MSRYADISGVILAGGRASRFGSNKAFALYKGVSLIERVISVFRPLFPEILLVVNEAQAYTPLGLRIVTDITPYQGPLGGIGTALHEAACDRVFVGACDMPLMNPETITRIIEAGEGHDAAVPIQNGEKEYLMAVYSRKLLPQILSALQGGRLSIKEFCQEVEDIVWVPIGGRDAFDVNRREDLEALEGRK